MTGRRAPLLVAVIVSVALLVVWLVLLPGWAEKRHERARTELAEAIETPPRSGGPGEGGASGPQTRALRWLEHGLAALDVTSGEGARLHPLVRKRPAEWTRGERAMVTALARRQPEALANLERAGSLGEAPLVIGSLRGSPEELSEPVLRASTLLLARAGLALRSAPAEAGRTLEAIAGIARALDDGEAGLAALRITVEDLYVRGVHWVAESPEASRPVLEDLRQTLPQLRPERRILRLVERLASDLGAPASPRPADAWDRIVPWWPDLRRARELESLTTLARASREPGHLLETAESVAAVLRAPETVDVMLRIQAAGSALILARLALEIRLAPSDGVRALDRRVAAVPPDPLAGTRPRVTRWVDGSLMVANASAEEAWAEYWTELAAPAEPPPYSWLLPPPGGDR